MPPNNILVDSSFLYALFDENNEHNATAMLISEAYHGQFLIPNIILTETAYLFKRQGGVPAVIQFLDRLTIMQPLLTTISIADLIRARTIMATYQDAKLDFVDCCIMALSERLNITQVCTYDQRDFSIFRPEHTSYLEILP